MQHQHPTQPAPDLCTERILLIGAGGVGAPLAIYLGNLSQELFILDPDEYEKKNMHRQPLARGQIGEAKVDCLAAALAPWTSAKVTPIQEWFTKENGKHIIDQTQPNLIVVAVDNDEAREAIWEHAPTHDILWAANELWEPQAGISRKHAHWNPADIFMAAEGGNDPICGEQSIKANSAAACLAAYLLTTTLEEGEEPFIFISKQKGQPTYTLQRDEI